MKFFIKTLGCKVNQSESEQIAAGLLQRGLTSASSVEKADLVIINTCTVTQVADSKSRQMVNKALGNGRKVIVTGCAVENANSGLSGFKGIELVPQQKKVDIFTRFGEPISPERLAVNRSRPYLKIQDGCSHKCSYCIVPLVRGMSRSLPAEGIIKKAVGFLKQGFKELVLTGVDIGAYDHQGLSLADLIKELLKLEPVFRIRLSSIEPQSLSQELLAFMAKEKRVCRHIHLPLQSGSDRILKLMNRPYNISNFMCLVEKLKRGLPNVAITSDVIVGFPSETEEDFLQTLAVVKQVKFTKTHIFRFSQRPDTEAVNFKGAIAEVVKKRRAAELSKAADKLVNDFKKSQTGTLAEVLIERKDDKYFKGTSSNYLPIYIASTRKLTKGKLTQIKIGEFKDGRLFGNIN